MTPPEVEAAVAEAHRDGWASVLASTVRVTRDLDLAEQSVQEAYADALMTWPHAGIPGNPLGWLTTTAKRRAIDAIRRRDVFRSKLPLLVDPEPATHGGELGGSHDPEDPLVFGAAEVASNAEVVRDERLRLIFLCCHPALSQEAQLALTLRLVCGVSTSDIARALLLSDTAMAARITRAKRKIAVSRIPFRMPEATALPARLRPVLAVTHVLFTTGYAAPSGAELLRPDLVDDAIRIARLLRELLPEERDVAGLLALLLATDARRATRTDRDGRLVRLEDQDRSRWDRSAIAEAHELIVTSLQGGSPGRYGLQAAIAALHAEAPDSEHTDWPQILTLYDELLGVWPSPVVALNRAVALSMVAGPQRALEEVERLEQEGGLERYPYLPAVEADLLHRLGRTGEAADAYRRALHRTGNDAERGFLTARLEDLRGR